jgi:hypothetical protein
MQQDCLWIPDLLMSNLVNNLARAQKARTRPRMNGYPPNAGPSLSVQRKLNPVGEGHSKPLDKWTTRVVRFTIKEVHFTITGETQADPVASHG